MRGGGRGGVCLFDVPDLPRVVGKRSRRTSVRRPLVMTVSKLEGEFQTKLDLPLCADTVHAGAVADSERLVISLRGAVNRTTSRAEQQTIHRVRGQVEIGEVEQVVEAHARLESYPFSERVPPGQSEIERPQPGEVHLPTRRVRRTTRIVVSRRRRQTNVRGHPAQRLELCQRHQTVLNQ